MISNIAKIIFATLIISLAPISFASPEDEATAFVNETGLGTNLLTMALRVSKNTRTYRTMVANNGESEASALVSKHIQKSVNNHQEEWNKNLADSYLEHFSLAELNSIKLEKSNSPHLSKFRTKKKDVGASMQAKSNKLLQKIVTKALTNAFTDSKTAKK
jgi:hypothetical protein